MAVLAVLTSVAGVYYYLRVLVYMYMRPQKRELGEEVGHPASKFAIVACGLMTLYLGVLPARGLNLSRQAIVDFAGAPEALQQVIDRGAAQMESEADADQ